MPRIWGWFGDSQSLVQSLKSFAAGANVSLWMRRADLSADTIVVVGPQSHEVAPYPFLDACHHLVRLGIDPKIASRYAEKLSQGASIVCIEANAEQLAQSQPRFLGQDPWVGI